MQYDHVIKNLTLSGVCVYIFHVEFSLWHIKIHIVNLNGKGDFQITNKVSFRVLFINDP